MVSDKKIEADLEFNRSKIYEKLVYIPQPSDYSGSLPWVIQNQIAATNGIHYVSRIGKLKDYPSYELPVELVTGNKLMLDIGSGWGRWLVSGFKKGYIPVGLDIRLEFCKTQQEVLKHHRIKGYSVVGDLEKLPFAPNSFDLVWSFSVLQHTHRIRLINCLQGIDSVLTEKGFTKLELPNKMGLRNRFRSSLIHHPDLENYNSWTVRYYTLPEYQKLIEPALQHVTFSTHSMLGIGVLKEDLKYVSVRNKIFASGSLLLTGLARVITPLKYVADSVYVTATKRSKAMSNPTMPSFLQFHHEAEFDNLNILKILKCPQSGGGLSLSEDRKKVLSMEAGIYYPVENNIPIMIVSEAQPM